MCYNNKKANLTGAKSVSFAKFIEVCSTKKINSNTNDSKLHIRRWEPFKKHLYLLKKKDKKI